MRIARYEAGGDVHYGAIEAEGLRRLRGSPFASLALSDIVDAPDAVRLLCPVAAPRIFGVGLNYVSHIREAGAATPQRPMLFMKPSTAAIGPEAPIVLPPESGEVHFEGELAVVIGRRARRLSEADAPGAILGYACANDVSARDIQAQEMAIGCLLIGKGFDSFCPLGPCIATGLDPSRLQLEAHVNGALRQSIETSDLLFPVAQLVAYLSSAVTLLPGDVILTGTPAGVGPIAPGDRVTVAVDGIGALSNPVVAETAVRG